MGANVYNNYMLSLYNTLRFWLAFWKKTQGRWGIFNHLFVEHDMVDIEKIFSLSVNMTPN